MRIRAYISGPLTDGGLATDAEQDQHLRHAVDAWRALHSMGLSPFCPHLTLFLERQFGVRLTHEQWIAADLPWVEASDILLRLPGPSRGADEEVACARALNIPVCYSLDELRELLEPPETFPLEELADK